MCTNQKSILSPDLNTNRATLGVMCNPYRFMFCFKNRGDICCNVQQRSPNMVSDMQLTTSAATLCIDITYLFLCSVSSFYFQFIVCCQKRNLYWCRKDRIIKIPVTTSHQTFFCVSSLEIGNRTSCSC